MKRPQEILTRFATPYFWRWIFPAPNAKSEFITGAMAAVTMKFSVFIERKVRNTFVEPVVDVEKTLITLTGDGFMSCMLSELLLHQR